LCCFLFFVTIPASMSSLKTTLAVCLSLGLVVAAWYLAIRPSTQSEAGNAEQLLSSGIAKYEESDFQGAIGVLGRVPSDTPQAARARYFEGSAYMMLRDYESAVAKLEESLALQADDTGTLYALGVAYYKLGNLKLARGYFAAVLEINPNDEQAKGLMDIMAKLERQSAPGADAQETSGD